MGSNSCGAGWMVMVRFFCSDLHEQMEVVKLDREEAHHARVMRIRESDTVFVLTGRGLEITGTIHFRRSNDVYIQVSSARQVDRMSKFCILGLAMPECRNTLAKIIRSAVELGVTGVCLLITHYSGFRKTGDVVKYMTRLKSIMISACKQSGQLWLPSLPDPMDLKEFFASLPKDVSIYVGWEPELNGSQSELKSDPQTRSGFAWIIGPEGGWSPEDLSVIQSSKPICIRFGTATLTMHVAAIAGLAALKTHVSMWN
jgi:16S rRNA (uracil1498-N3)-methyltransferase